MALTVETGQIVPDADAYVTLSECNTYHLNMNNSGWTGTDAVKEAAIRKATAYIDNKYAPRWKGSRTQPGQPLLWPRSFVLRFEDEERAGYAQTPVYVPGNEIPKVLKNAVCEAALRALSGDLEEDLERGGQVASVQVGSISTTYAQGAPAGKKYPIIDNLLRTLLKTSGMINLVRSCSAAQARGALCRATCRNASFS